MQSETIVTTLEVQERNKLFEMTALKILNKDQDSLILTASAKDDDTAVMPLKMLE
jgi:hypothetical protein